MRHNAVKKLELVFIKTVGAHRISRACYNLTKSRIKPIQSHQELCNKVILPKWNVTYHGTLCHSEVYLQKSLWSRICRISSGVWFAHVLYGVGTAWMLPLVCILAHESVWTWLQARNGSASHGLLVWGARQQSIERRMTSPLSIAVDMSSVREGVFCCFSACGLESKRVRERAELHLMRRCVPRDGEQFFFESPETRSNAYRQLGEQLLCGWWRLLLLDALVIPLSNTIQKGTLLWNRCALDPSTAVKPSLTQEMLHISMYEVETRLILQPT